MTSTSTPEPGAGPHGAAGAQEIADASVRRFLADDTAAQALASPSATSRQAR